MGNFNGYLFTVIAGLGPPAVVLAGYLLQWRPLLHSSFAAKTFLALAYSFVLKKQVIPYLISPFRKLPSPKDNSILFGHALSMISSTPGSNFLEWMHEVPNDGIISFDGIFHLGNGLVLTTPEAIMEVINTRAYDYQKPVPVTKFLARIIGNGLVNVEGNEHKRQRKSVAPAFSGKHIKNLVPLFWGKGLLMAESIKREIKTNDGTVEMAALASRATLDIIGAAAIGKDFGTTENADHELTHEYGTLTDTNSRDLVVYFFLNTVFPPAIARRLPLAANRKVTKASQNLRRITKELLAEKTMDLKESSIEQKDIIAILQRTENFDNDGLVDQLLTFLAAGHETTAAALTWTMYLLSKHSDIQNRLRTELQTSCSTTDPPSAETLDALPLLDAVCTEVLRLYPPIPITSRVALRDTYIGSMPIPKGAGINISPWALHRSPTVWGADAAEFRPERWMGEGGKHGGAESAYAFMTFLYGPRSCIGQSFTRYELKALVVAMLLSFGFELKRPEEEPVPAGILTIKPKGGMELVVTRL